MDNLILGSLRQYDHKKSISDNRDEINVIILNLNLQNLNQLSIRNKYDTKVFSQDLEIIKKNFKEMNLLILVLQKKITEEKKFFDSLKEENLSFKEKNIIMIENISRLKQENEEFLEEIENAIRKNNLIKEKLADKKAKINCLNQKNTELQNEKNNISMEYYKFKRIHGDQLNKIKESDMCFDSEKIAEINPLKTKNSLLIIENKELESKNAKLTQNINELNLILVEMSQSKENFETEKIKIQTEINDLNNKNKELCKIIESKNDKSNKTIEEELKLQEKNTMIKNFGEKNVEKRDKEIGKETNKFENSQKDIKIGSHILVKSDFIFIKEIKKGSFGIVNLVVDKATESKHFAIKSINTKRSNKTKEDIENEIKLWEKIDNLKKPRSIPNFYGYFEEKIGWNETNYYLMFEYFPNSLKNVIINSKNNVSPFPIKKILHYAKSLIYSLAYMQTMNICHLDLKPDNILLDESLNNVYIIDFSESKEIVTCASDQTKEELTLVGSPQYFSPELYKAYKKKDQKKPNFNPFKSDIFSLGLTLLELGTLEIPDRDDDLDTYEKNIKKKIRKFRKKYEAVIDENNTHIQDLEILLDILKDCLRIHPDIDKRPDFINLFFRLIQKSKNPENTRQFIYYDENKCSN